MIEKYLYITARYILKKCFTCSKDFLHKDGFDLIKGFKGGLRKDIFIPVFILISTIVVVPPVFHPQLHYIKFIFS